MLNLFENLLISSPNGGGLFFSHGGEVFCLDVLDTTGFVYHRDIILRCLQPNDLIIYDNRAHLIPGTCANFNDVHDVLWEGGYCYLVSTDRNEIIKLSRAGDELQRWVFPGEKDSWHINCLCNWRGRIIFSAFGDFRDHRGYKGKSLGAGFVQDLFSGERLIRGLSQPHSLVVVKDNLFLANSEQRELIEFSADGNILRTKKLDGYTRGILVLENTIYVGLSCSRNIELEGITSATVVALNLETLEELGRLQIPTKEIYAIQHVPVRDDLARVLATIGATSSAILKERLNKRDGQIASLSQAVTERDGQIASLSQAVTERDGQIEALRVQLAAMSEWAADIDKHPLKHAFKRTVLGIARRTLRYMPVSIAAKQRLRDAFFSTIRPLRRSVRRKSDQIRLTEEAPPSRANIPAAGDERDIFIFAVIDWHFRIQRPQHIARSLAEFGHRVFYFSNHFVDADEPGYQLERLHGAEALYQVKLHVKGAAAIYFASPSDQVLAMLTRSIAMVIQDFSAISSSSIVQHPFWYPLVKRLPNSYRIYDCIDYHEGFGNFPTQLVEIEKEMLSSADLVTVTSSWLEEIARKHNPNVALIRNAAEYSLFAMRPEHVYKDGKGRQIIGYYGAIAEWFDLDLVRTIAMAFPDRLIMLVGNDTVGAQKTLADLPNVEFVGEVPYAMLPFYLHAFDVCLLPFKVNPLTLATNPVKIYEYLAAGKPVVSIDLPEVSQFGKLVSRACSYNDFVSMVDAALQESGIIAEHNAAERRRFSSEQTWRHRGAELANALKEIRMPRVSVIILTFNNLELTRACLDSVILRSDYPNLEIIIIDNASTDDTPAYLQDFARHHPDVRVVLNRENLGFAAGNNIGLSIATGDYLVLLNNDTIVTQGWIMTLLRHFQNNPNLGIICPVTNNIGNEARIKTQYQDIAEMPGETLQYTLSNMGKIYPLRTAAFFCVMLPRSVYELCGPISEEYGLGFFEDDDYCRKVESSGLAIACAEDVFVHHHLSASFNKLNDEKRRELFNKNKAIYEKKWGPWIPHKYRKQAAWRP